MTLSRPYHWIYKLMSFKATKVDSKSWGDKFLCDAVSWSDLIRASPLWTVYDAFAFLYWLENGEFLYWLENGEQEEEE